MHDCKKMKTFYICYCGNPKDSHNFRHIYVETSKVERKESTFYLDACKFPVKQGDKCSVPNCSALKSLHQTKVLDHEYQPEKFEYREIRLCIPKDTVCKKCSLTLEEHFVKSEPNKNVMSHSFAVGMDVTNKKETDKLIPFDREDEDRKIIITN